MGPESAFNNGLSMGLGADLSSPSTVVEILLQGQLRGDALSLTMKREQDGQD